MNIGKQAAIAVRYFLLTQEVERFRAEVGTRAAANILRVLADAMDQPPPKPKEAP